MDFKNLLRMYLEVNGITQVELADMTGDSQQAISDFLSKDSTPRKSTRNKYFDRVAGFAKFYKDNTSNEAFNNLQKDEVAYKMIKDHRKTVTAPKGVPYYDVDFTASFVEVENNQQSNPDHYVTHPFFTGCDFIVRASGQSMAKIIKHGDAIGLLEVRDWQSFMPLGEIYAIVTTNGFRMIKIVTKGDADDTYTLLSKPSDSKVHEFPPQQIKKKHILSIFKVQASSHLF